MNTGKVVLAFIHPGTVSGMFTESLVMLMQHDHSHQRRILNGGDVVSMASGPRIASARNEIARAFLSLKGKPEWLLMLDADMTFPADIVDRMVKAANESEAKILGGLCFGGGRAGHIFPTLYRMTAPDEDGNCVEIIEDYPENALVRVDATGCACLMVHRSALERIHEAFGTVDTKTGVRANPSPWFAESHYAGREFGEDWTMMMRAAQVGINVYVHTGIKVGHLKSHLLDETSFAQFRAERDRLGSKEAVADDYRKRAFG